MTASLCGFFLRKGGTMKTIGLLTLLTLGVVVASGCHWHHHRSNYSDGYSR